LSGENRTDGPAGRGYRLVDIDLLKTVGVSSGLLSVLVLGLYINSPDVRSLYAGADWLWSACLVLLYWIMRVWMKSARGEMHADPVVFALRDRASWAMGALLAAIGVAAAVIKT